MKQMAVITFICFTALIATAPPLGLTTPFPGWDRLIQRSSDIIIVQCITPRNLAIPVEVPYHADIKVVDVLKGQTNRNSTCLLHHSHLHNNEYYLVFTQFREGCYASTADYELVSVGGDYVKEMAAGESLEDKVRSFLKRRMRMIDFQIAREMEEKKRLAEAVQ